MNDKNPPELQKIYRSFPIGNRCAKLFSAATETGSAIQFEFTRDDDSVDCITFGIIHGPKPILNVTISRGNETKFERITISRDMIEDLVSFLFSEFDMIGPEK